MYPADELSVFTRRKELLRARIAGRRRECAQHWAVIERPLRVVDEGWRHWRAWAPWFSLAAVPAGLLFRRRAGAGRSILSRLARWAPLASSLTRAALNVRARRRRTEPPSATPNTHD